MTRGPHAAEIEAVIEEDKRQLRRKVTTACVCMGVFGAAVVIGGIYWLNMAMPFPAQKVASLVGILSLFAFSMRLVSPSERVTKFALVSLNLSLCHQALREEVNLYFAGISFGCMFLLMLLLDAIPSRKSKSESQESEAPLFDRAE